MQNGSTTESTDTQAAAVEFKNVSLRYSGAGDESLTDISFTVKKGQTIIILEAMKMENNINADKDGKITAINVNKGDSVLEGTDLVIIE